MEFILRIGLLFFFVIWSRVGHVSSAIAGIDLGSHTIKVSHRSQATSVIDIIPNSQGDRYRPSILLYKDGDFLLETLALNEVDRTIPSIVY